MAARVTGSLIGGGALAEIQVGVVGANGGAFDFVVRGVLVMVHLIHASDFLCETKMVMSFTWLAPGEDPPLSLAHCCFFKSNNLCVCLASGPVIMSVHCTSAVGPEMLEVSWNPSSTPSNNSTTPRLCRSLTEIPSNFGKRRPKFDLFCIGMPAGCPGNLVTHSRVNNATFFTLLTRVLFGFWFTILYLTKRVLKYIF